MSDIPRILIVEDSPTQAMRLEMDLTANGWQVMCAHTADGALLQLDVWTPDLLLVDYNLPGVRGDEFCRRVRMNINTRGIPIIMLTADDDEGVELRGLDSGADDFFKKSADTELLVLRIRAMLENSRRTQCVLRQSDSYFKRARILAVDDSRTYLTFLGDLLTAEGYSVTTIVHSSEAVRCIEDEHFDCVLVDLVMPELDGIEVCRRIVAIRNRLDNPVAVLMLTGRETREDLTRALEAGADDFVGKSSDVAVLKGRIRALLRRKFFQEENQRILEELKNKELEAVRARADKEAALARAAEERRQHAEAVAEELRQAQANLEAANQGLVRYNEELRQFAFVVSHDLQEPLRSVISFCNLLSESYKGRLDEQADDFIRRIINGASRMKSLVRDLLSYSRLGHNEQKSFEPVASRGIVEEALENVRASINNAHAQITCGELPTIIADRLQLVQLFQNLIANAIQYRGEDPPVIRIESGRRDGVWEFAVYDNGIGIAPEHHERIFEIFKRIHGRNEYPGTGIGLAICKKIVQRHGGKIWVESAPAEGSVFRFTIEAPNQETTYETDRCLATSV